MPGIAMPFGRERSGAAARWPAWVAAAKPSGRLPGPADPWLDPVETWAGETALEDLDQAQDAEAVTRILARYLVVRLLRSAVRAIPGFEADLERAAAQAYLLALPPDDPDRRALLPIVADLAATPDPRFARRLDRAASVGLQHAHWRSVFALLHAGYGVARAADRQLDAALVARRLAALTLARGEAPAARRWSLRARAHEKRQRQARAGS